MGVSSYRNGKKLLQKKRIGKMSVPRFLIGPWGQQFNLGIKQKYSISEIFSRFSLGLFSFGATIQTKINK